MPTLKYWDVASAAYIPVPLGAPAPGASGISADYPIPQAGQTLISQFVAAYFNGGGPTANGDMFAVPTLIPKTHTFTGIDARLWTGGSSGAVIRFGIYNDSGFGQPGTLLADLGTAVATGNNLATIAMSQTLQGNTLAWLVCVPQGAPTTLPTFITYNLTAPLGPLINPGFSLAQATSGANYWYIAGVTGALPASPAWAVAVPGNNTRMPVIGLIA